MDSVGRKGSHYENQDNLGKLNPNLKPQIYFGNSQPKGGKKKIFPTLHDFFFLHEVAAQNFSLWIKAFLFKITNIPRGSLLVISHFHWYEFLESDGFAPRFEFKEMREENI